VTSLCRVHCSVALSAWACMQHYSL